MGPLMLAPYQYRHNRTTPLSTPAGQPPAGARSAGDGRGRAQPDDPVCTGAAAVSFCFTTDTLGAGTCEWARLGSNQRPLACEAVALISRIARKHRGRGRSDLIGASSDVRGCARIYAD